MSHVVLPRSTVELLREFLVDNGEPASLYLEALDAALSAPEPFVDHGERNLSIASSDGLTISVYADDDCSYIGLLNQHGVGVGGLMVDKRGTRAVALALLALTEEAP